MSVYTPLPRFYILAKPHEFASVGFVTGMEGPDMLECDGAAYPKADYPELYAALLNTPRRRLLDRIVCRHPPARCLYGETETTFNVPDYRGFVTVIAHRRLP